MASISRMSVVPLVIALAGSVPAYAEGNAEAGKTKATACAACHGADGNSQITVWPKLAGQHASYLVKQLQDFKAGRRVDAANVMRPMAAPLSERDIEDLAAYFSSQAVSPGTGQAEVMAQGEKVFRRGDVYQKVIACVGCHGLNGEGNPNLQAPALRSQHADYLAFELQQFNEGKRANDVGSVMRNIAGGLKKEEMNAVAQYISSLAP